MDQAKRINYQHTAASIINKLKARHMEGFYCEDLGSAKEKVIELIENGMDQKPSKGRSVAYGGSMTIDNTDLKAMIEAAGHKLIVREDYKTPEEMRELKALSVNADSFIMSTNAITLDGELINIDGRGNRLSFMIYGPDQVIILAGMNKVVTGVEDGIRRVRNIAAPANTVRLGCDTPCALTGQCANCLKNTICDQIVVTRASMIPGRIKVVLFGEEAGY
ncbi:lactate utilization protein [Candidatus Weimeria sp. HCP3S3_B5]|uniref:lactate utilization protein n=1 Tax=Candidatus Weimeria sp. HCP3S3_B5 TaxID=3438871 RepID=UPI003F8BF159